MEQLLQNFSLPSHSINDLTSQSVADMMSVLGADISDFESNTTVRPASDETNNEQETTELINAELKRLLERQKQIDIQYAKLFERINLARSRLIGSHIVEELLEFKEHFSNQTEPPKQDISSTVVTLPKVPNILPVVSQSNIGDVTQLSAVELCSSTSLNISEHSDIPVNCETTPAKSMESVVNMNIEESKVNHSLSIQSNLHYKQKETLERLKSNLLDFVDGFDSDATESSSGGESCDETETFPQNSDVTNPPITKRAKWLWASHRAVVGSRWTWLLAQISDLEYKIRQHTEYFRRIRTAKGCISFENQKIDVDNNSGEGASSSIRTRPMKEMRKRQLLTTKLLYKTSKQAAKKNRVRCTCVQPSQWCIICQGRRDYTQNVDPVFQERRSAMAVLDHGYHNVLSFPHEATSDVYHMDEIRSRSWMKNVVQPIDKKSNKKLSAAEFNSSQMSKKSRKSASGVSKSGGGADDNKHIINKKNVLPKNSKQLKVLLTKCETSSLNDGKILLPPLPIDGNEQFKTTVTSPCVLLPPSSISLPMPEAVHRRCRETSFDIDDIVIPSSFASSSRVEQIHYKEIVTPSWKIVTEVEGADEGDDDISLASIEKRHYKAEQEEKIRWKTPFWKQSGVQSRRKSSRSSVTSHVDVNSGANTPDSSLSPTLVETRPTSPFIEVMGGLYEEGSRRVSNINSGSRCTTPSISCDSLVEEAQPPFEPREFPLSEEEFSYMCNEGLKNASHERITLRRHSARNKGVNLKVDLASSSIDSEILPDEEPLVTIHSTHEPDLIVDI